MSKRGYISRYILIIKILQKKPYCSYEQLRNHLEQSLETMQLMDDTLEVGYSLRTLQRDFREIRNLFRYNIEYSRKNKGYFLENVAEGDNSFLNLVENYQLHNMLNAGKDLTNIFYPEKRKPLGTGNLLEILGAIQNRYRLEVSHQKFSEKATLRTLHPYAIREFKDRWYVIAFDEKDSRIKSFALDRILDITTLKTKRFKIAPGFDAHEMYEHCFGIIGANGANPVEVILSFDAYQGEFIRTLPLHTSQKIITDNKDEFCISLKLVITHDFTMELLSYGDAVKVIKPASLVKELKQIYLKALKQYN